MRRRQFSSPCSSALFLSNRPCYGFGGHLDEQVFVLLLQFTIHIFLFCQNSCFTVIIRQQTHANTEISSCCLIVKMAAKTVTRSIQMLMPRFEPTALQKSFFCSLHETKVKRWHFLNPKPTPCQIWALLTSYNK